jgi:Flp pilus assembly protein TadG
MTKIYCLHTFRKIIKEGIRRIRCNSGNSTLEFAVVFSFFGVPLLLGTTEVASVVYDSIEVSNAAHAGASYAMMSSTFASDGPGIQNAAQADAADFGTNLTVTSTPYYACSAAVDGTQYSTQIAASVACPANASNHYLQFVQVVSKVTVNPPVQLPGLPKSWTVSGSSIAEVEE